MDVYLPNDFYELRSDLPDWSDASPAGTAEHKSEPCPESADPSWQAL